MRAAGVAIVCAALAGLLALCGGFYIRTLHDELETSQKAAKEAKQATEDRDETIRKLLASKRRNDLARKRLDENQGGIRAMLADRETNMRKLQNENPETRAWSAVSLPDVVVRLRQHGPITGAADYRKRMHESGTLQPAGR